MGENLVDVWCSKRPPTLAHFVPLNGIRMTSIGAKIADSICRVRRVA